ncbi:Bug family tripartite tricarboxylate transporter substrate binding protein [Pigmentiphaga litoralis]|uniref:Bug family tripartite tricarboxylate transporter substrate binding protein n=1 Tax=Pigmentiphaga litoralis TaxID=516702 RepID=UPI00389A68DE
MLPKSPFTVVLSCALIALMPIKVLADTASYPSRPVRLVVPFPAGGPADILGRIIAQGLSESLGQQVIVDNRGGANTVIGAQTVARAAPDGYTLLLAIDSTLAMNPSLYSKLAYDPAKDFEPIGLVAEVPCIIAVNNSFPAENLAQLLALARVSPGKINFAHGTVTMHVGGELLNQMAKVRMTPVAYKGGGTSIVAVMGGEVQVTMEAAATIVPNAQAGKVRPLAVMGARRIAAMPDLLTVAESGVPGYDVSVWQSLVAPAGTPPEIINRLNREVTALMNRADTKVKLEKIGLAPLTSSPQELAAFVKSQTAKWSTVIQDIGLRID